MIESRATYFMMTSRTTGRESRIIMTVNSIMMLEKVSMNEIKKALCTLLKFYQWLTAYFIIVIPLLMSFSTLRCIIILAINLAAKMLRLFGIFQENFSSKIAKFQIM